MNLPPVFLRFSYLCYVYFNLPEYGGIYKQGASFADAPCFILPKKYAPQSADKNKV